MKHTGVKKLIFYRANGIDSTELELKLNAQDLSGLQENINKEIEERGTADASLLEAVNGKLLTGLLVSVTVSDGNAKINYTLEE